MNKIILSGRLTADPESKFTPNGKQVTRFRLAVDRGFKKDDGTKETDFFSCEAWGKTAEVVEKYCFKGNKILVEGRVQIRQYEKNGEKRNVTEVVVEKIELLGSKNDNQGQGQSNGQQRAQAQSKQDDYPGDSPDDYPGDLPF